LVGLPGIFLILTYFKLFLKITPRQLFFPLDDSFGRACRHGATAVPRWCGAVRERDVGPGLPRHMQRALPLHAAWRGNGEPRAARGSLSSSS
jgi:hypothetical protein